MLIVQNHVEQENTSMHKYVYKYISWCIVRSLSYNITRSFVLYIDVITFPITSEDKLLKKMAKQ